jgi:hypothetical protein
MKTTLRKLISEIDFNKSSVQSTPNWEDLSKIFNLELYWSEDTRLKCYFIKKWLCTDSFVGFRAYFLDDEFVAISYQEGRKFDEEFDFVSKKLAEKVRNYLISLLEPEGINVGLIGSNVLDEEIPSTYKIKYNSQILHKTALYNGERVDIVKTIYDWEEKDKYFHTVEIKDKNNKKFEVHVNELDFEYNV